MTARSLTGGAVRSTGSGLYVPPPGQDGTVYIAPAVDLLPGPSWEADPSPVIVSKYEDGGDHYVTPSREILEAFVRLPLVPERDFPRAVLGFARQYGVLGICRHGKPFGHGPGRCTPHGASKGWPFYEPVSAWLRYSRQLRAILAVAERLANGTLGADQDWDTIVSANPPELAYPAPHPPEPATLSEFRDYQTFDMQWNNAMLSRADFPDFRLGDLPTDPIGNQKFWVQYAVDVWLRYGMVRQCPAWLANEDQMRASQGVGNLPAVLAVELMTTLMAPLYVCAGCGTAGGANLDKRRPAIGRKFWCATCGRGEQKRVAARRHYQLNKPAAGARAAMTG